MHKWGSKTNGPQVIWGNRGYGSQHVLVPGINEPWTVGTKGPFEALGLYGIQHIWSTSTNWPWGKNFITKKL